METKLSGPETAEAIYQAIYEAAMKTGHKEFTKYGKATGIIIIAFIGDEGTALHRIGLVNYEQAISHILQMAYERIRGAGK